MSSTDAPLLNDEEFWQVSNDVSFKGPRARILWNTGKDACYRIVVSPQSSANYASVYVEVRSEDQLGKLYWRPSTTKERDLAIRQTAEDFLATRWREDSAPTDA